VTDWNCVDRGQIQSPGAENKDGHAQQQPDTMWPVGSSQIAGQADPSTKATPSVPSGGVSPHCVLSVFKRCLIRRPLAITLYALTGRVRINALAVPPPAHARDWCSCLYYYHLATLVRSFSSKTKKKTVDFLFKTQISNFTLQLIFVTQTSKFNE
jgi:hypothetical protein